jgi:hypothetical protein
VDIGVMIKAGGAHPRTRRLCFERQIRVSRGMRLLRGLAGAVLWILAAVVGLVGILLCVTIVLLPVGWVLMGYAGRLFALAMKLILPRAVTHPTETVGKSLHDLGRQAKEEVSSALPDRKRVRKRARRLRKRVA